MSVSLYQKQSPQSNIIKKMNKEESQKFVKDVYNFLIKEDDEPIFFPDFISLLGEQNLHKDDRKIKYLDDFLFSFEEKFGRVEIILSSRYNSNESVIDSVDDENEFYLLYFLDKDIYLLFQTWPSNTDRYAYWTKEYVAVEQVVPTEIKITKYIGVF